LHDVITELIEARKRAGVHCQIPVKIYHANNDGYLAQIVDTMVMKLGHFDWNLSKEINLDGNWQKFVDKGVNENLDRDTMNTSDSACQMSDLKEVILVLLLLVPSPHEKVDEMKSELTKYMSYIANQQYDLSEASFIAEVVDAID
ncbi:probable alpha-amylase 2 isoform X2, partial [Tanacetum coccineum]